MKHIKDGTVVFEKGKTDEIFNGVRFCLWRLLHTMSSPTTKAVNDSHMNNMILLNNVEEVCRHMVDIKSD